MVEGSRRRALAAFWTVSRGLALVSRRAVDTWPAKGMPVRGQRQGEPREHRGGPADAPRAAAQSRTVPEQTAPSFAELAPGPHSDRTRTAAAVQAGGVYTEASPPSEAAGPLRTAVPASRSHADGYVADAYGKGPEPASTHTDASRPAGTKPP